VGSRLESFEANLVRRETHGVLANGCEGAINTISLRGPVGAATRGIDLPQLTEVNLVEAVGCLQRPKHMAGKIDRQ
jgi:hypothetical protein